MLLAYYKNTGYTVFFIIFVIIGVFFLSNVLLAVIFDNYKRRIELNSVKRVGNRRQHVEKIYNKFDTEGKGYLTISQARKFFALTLDLNFKYKSHQRIFRKTLKHLDVEETKQIKKERIMTYFALGGFLVLQQMDKEQKELDEEVGSNEDVQLSQGDTSGSDESELTDASFDA